MITETIAAVIKKVPFPEHTAKGFEKCKHGEANTNWKISDKAKISTKRHIHFVHTNITELLPKRNHKKIVVENCCKIGLAMLAKLNSELEQQAKNGTAASMIPSDIDVFTKKIYNTKGTIQEFPHLTLQECLENKKFCTYVGLCRWPDCKDIEPIRWICDISAKYYPVNDNFFGD